jgi:hypothetical protein
MNNRIEGRVKKGADDIIELIQGMQAISENTQEEISRL